MAETMLAAAANSTSTHYGYGHMCRKHNKLFTLVHIETYTIRRANSRIAACLSSGSQSRMCWLRRRLAYLLILVQPDISSQVSMCSNVKSLLCFLHMCPKP